MKKTLIAVGAGLSVPVIFGGAMMIAATTYAAKPGTEPPPEPSEPIVLYCDGLANYYTSTGEYLQPNIH